MIIAVEGCAHGEMETIYDTIKCLEQEENVKIDLLICCGDFQSSRNEQDLLCMAVPLKYCHICSFYKYYSGEKIAPVLTIFVGGNHEASNYLQELPYGGWVAPNIYYLGYAGVINIAGIRIGGMSGIYKSNDYLKGHFERSPFNESQKRSIYHLRNLEVFRMKQVSRPINIFVSHDWPTGICEFGRKNQLIKFKPHFREDIESGQLGSKPGEELLHQLKPDYWFSAHLHCKFAALVPHEDGTSTKFLALDKCLPRRRFLQILKIPHDEEKSIEICYDLEWLSILFLTNHLLSVKNALTFMPGMNSSERWKFTPTEAEKDLILAKFENDLKVPLNFVKTAEVYDANNPKKLSTVKQPNPVLNPQTQTFCKKLGIDDPIDLLLEDAEKETSFKDDNLSQTYGNTFIEDTDLSDDSFAPTNIPIKKLSLPEPKMAKYEGFEIEESVSEAKNDGQAESEPIKVPEVSKTFVRRNADIYSMSDGQ